MSKQGHHSSAAPNNCVIIGNNNSYLVKRNSGGGVQFSRDPLNLANVNSRKVRTSLMAIPAVPCPVGTGPKLV